MKDYKTVFKEATAEFVEKKSRFISFSRPVKTSDEATSFISEIKGNFPDATHHVFAYRIRENNIQRYSDDGEPSGTAGMPVLDVILKEDLYDICIVVVRYFGGTLLGTGGLVHAYSKGAKDSILSNVCTMRFSSLFEIEYDYALHGKIMHLADTNSYTVQSSDFSDKVRLCLCVPYSEKENLVKSVTEATAGKCKICATGEQYIKI